MCLKLTEKSTLVQKPSRKKTDQWWKSVQGFSQYYLYLSTAQALKMAVLRLALFFDIMAFWWMDSNRHKKRDRSSPCKQWISHCTFQSHISVQYCQIVPSKNFSATACLLPTDGTWSQFGKAFTKCIYQLNFKPLLSFNKWHDYLLQHYIATARNCVP